MTSSAGLVLLVEDEPAIAEVVSLYLRRAGLGVEVVRDGVAGLKAVERLSPVLVILDLGLPGLDGSEVLARLRSKENWVPVLVVTARDEEVERILTLESGADDYLVKPFSPRELVARVRSLLRRSQFTTPAARVSLGEVVLDPGSREVWEKGEERHLTTTEFDLLLHLLRHPGRVFTREQLLSAVWGYSAEGGTRTVDVHVAQIRSKLSSDAVRTVRGVGYAARREGQ